MSTSTARRPDQRGFRNRGEWILVDAGLQHLLAIGQAMYAAISPRASLDHVARRILLPELRAAVKSRRAVNRITRMQGHRWRVLAVPLLGTGTQSPIAVLGCYDSPGQAVSEPPPVGTWEWRITPPGPSQQLRVYVSPQLYAVHGLPGVASVVSGSQLDDLVAMNDRPALRAFFRALIIETEPRLRLCDFTSASPTGNRYALRNAGRRYDETTGAWLRGITIRQHDELVPAEPGHLDAVLALSRDPVWLIDPMYELVYLTSDSFATHSLRPTPYLPELCHEEDLPALRDYLRRAAQTPGQFPPPVHIRFATVDGGWRLLEVRGTGVRIAPAVTHVWCRIRALTG